MLTIALLAVGVPLLSAVAYLALRPNSSRRPADIRGIALQTVIIMVVLLAIAGAVAGVLLSQGQDAVTQVERQDVTRDPNTIHSPTVCEAFTEFDWDPVSETCEYAP